MSTVTKHVGPSCTRFTPTRTLFHPADPNGTSPIHRISAPLDTLRKNGVITAMVDFARLTEDKLKELGVEVVVDQHSYHEDHLQALKVYKKAGVTIVYEIDDLFWDMHASNPATKIIPADIRARMARGAAFADRVVTTTDALAARIRTDLNVPSNKIFVARNALSTKFVTDAISARTNRKSDKPRVGWAGSTSHADDLALLEEVVKRTHTKLQWVFVGSCPEGVQDLVEFHRAVPFTHYAAFLGSLDLDVGVIPLADTPFNRCKSDLKVLEYAAAGAAVVASPSPVFRERPGMPQLVSPVTNSVDDWVSALLEYTITGLCTGDAIALHDWVRKSAVLESPEIARQWACAWSNRKGEVFHKFAEPNGDVVFVGEPVAEPHYTSFAKAYAENPGATVVYVRPGCTPSREQIETLIESLFYTGKEGQKYSFSSVSATSNDGDYPTNGQFHQLDGDIARSITLAASLLNDDRPIPIPYSSSPMVALSAAAMTVVGAPDDERYGGDYEAALIDWSLRVGSVFGPSTHVASPLVYVRVQIPVNRNQATFRQQISEISAWYPAFMELQKQAAQDDMFRTWRKNLDLSYAAVSYQAPVAKDYTGWLQTHDTWGYKAQEWAKKDLAEWAAQPLVSVVMPMYNTPVEYLKAAVESVRGQVYQNWHLVLVDDNSSSRDHVAVAHALAAEDKRITVVENHSSGHICTASNTGLYHSPPETKWVLFLDHDDVLTDSCLYMLTRAVVGNADLVAVYGDSDLLSADGVLHSPDFKPNFDYDLLLAQNYVCHPMLYDYQKVLQIEGFRVGLEGSQDYDLILRYIEKFGRAVGHVPLVLYHWRQSADSVSSNIENKPYAIAAAHKAVLEHLQRTEQRVFVGPHPQAPLHNVVRFLPPEEEPAVTILMLTQKDRKMLEKCVTELVEKTIYKNYKLIIRQVGRDVGVTDSARGLAKKYPQVSFVQAGGDVDGSFNYALLNNALAGTAAGKSAEVLVFLNDDTVVIEPAWLGDMVGAALREDIGAVGLKLLYPDSRVQHGGVLLDAEAPAGEVAIHAFAMQAHNDPGPAARSVLARRMPAVTAACMAVQRSKFEQVGRFNAQVFPLDFNDIDLCLRLRVAGYDSLVLNHVYMHHVEGNTKKQRPDLLNRTGLLASEKDLTETEAFKALLAVGRLGSYSNPNLAHEPSQQMLRPKPPRPWDSEEFGAVTLVIGAQDDDATRIYYGGETPLTGVFDGPYLTIVEPCMPQVAAVDFRDKAAVDELVDVLNITRVVVRRLGKGSLEVLGMLGKLHQEGLPVYYRPADYESVCPRLTCSTPEGDCGHKWQGKLDECQGCVLNYGSQHGYVAVASYRNAWAEFGKCIEATGTES